jgi:hypothetical protein
MSVSGTWVLTISSPWGRHHVVVELEQDDDHLAGRVRLEDETVELADLDVDGARLTWLQGPSPGLPAALRVGVTVRGDTMTGHALAEGQARVSVLGMRGGAQAQEMR